MTRKSALVLALLAVAAVSASFAADRSKPPAAGPPKPLQLPAVTKLTLGNGLPVFLAEVKEVPVVEAVLVVRTGAAHDPDGRRGLAAMVAGMLDEGAGKLDALSLADEIEYLGAELATAAGWDAVTVRLHVPSARLDEALPLLADVVLRPRFPDAELTRLRKEALTSLLQARDDPRRLAGTALAQAVFGASHRYGHALGGDAASLSAITVSDLSSFHSTHFRPGNAALVVAGDFGPGVASRLEASFGSWPAGGSVLAPLLPPPASREKGPKIWLVDKPGAPQSAIRIGRLGPPRAIADYPALEVANTLLGAMFTSRLNDNLREQHGYTYGARSSFDYRRSGGAFVAGADVATQVTAPAVTEFLKELARIRTPATAEEVERARAFLALGQGSEFETTRQIAAKIVDQVVYGLPDDEYSTFVPKAMAVGPADLVRAVSRRIDPADLAIVVVGDREAAGGPLRNLGLARVRFLTVDEVMGPEPKIE